MDMARREDSAADRKRRTPADHIALKHDAIRSDAVQALVRNILVVAATDGEIRLLISLLRAALGRHVDARTAVGLTAADAEIGKSPPRAIIAHHTPGLGARAASIVTRWTATCGAPVILVCEPLDVREAAAVRDAGPLDVIERDDLDSVRLFEALLEAVGEAPDAAPPQTPDS